ncbi:hypothetical protein ACFL0Y_04645 [Patescibacteria group bacterium]
MLFKKEIKERLLLTFIWLIVISLLRWRFYLPLGLQTFDLVGFWLGGLLGTFFVDLDHWLHFLVIHPQEPTSLKIKQLLQSRRFKEAFILLSETRAERLKLTFHSALFQPLFYVLCFFVLTSTANHFGSALVMVMVLQLLKEELKPLLTGKEESLQKWLFWQIDIKASVQQTKVFVFVMLLAFLGLHLLLI